MKVSLDNYTRFILTALTVLLTIVSINLWCQAPSTVSTAQAAIPDSGQQLNELIIEVRTLNNSVNEMNNLLASGQVKVQIIDPKTKSSR